MSGVAPFPFLRRFGSYFIIPDLDAIALLCVPNFDKRLWILKAAREILKNVDLASSEAVAILLHTLNDSSSNKRREAAQSLRGLNRAIPEVLASLVAALHDSDPDVRQAAAQSLGRLKDATPEVIAALLQALRDDDLSVRQVAIVGLGRLGNANPRVVNALHETLQANSLHERMLAAQSLGMLRQASPQVCETLLEALCQIEESEGCSLCARLLGKLGHSDETTIQNLLHKLINPQYEVRAACTQALVRLGRRFPSTQTIIERELIRAINEPLFDQQDKTKRSGHDHAYEGLWLLITGGKIEERGD